MGEKQIPHPPKCGGFGMTTRRREKTDPPAIGGETPTVPQRRERVPLEDRGKRDDSAEGMAKGPEKRIPHPPKCGGFGMTTRAPAPPKQRPVFEPPCKTLSERHCIRSILGMGVR